MNVQVRGTRMNGMVMIRAECSGALNVLNVLNDLNELNGFNGLNVLNP